MDKQVFQVGFSERPLEGWGWGRRHPNLGSSLQISLNIRLLQNIHRCSHLDLQNLFPPLSLATGLAAGQEHILFEQVEKQREEQTMLHALPFPKDLAAVSSKPGRSHSCSHESTPFAFTCEPHVAKLWGSYAAMERRYRFSLLALCQNTGDGLKTKLPTEGEKEEESTARDRKEWHLPGSLTSVLLPFYWEEEFKLHCLQETSY